MFTREREFAEIDSVSGWKGTGKRTNINRGNYKTIGGTGCKKVRRAKWGIKLGAKSAYNN